MGSLTKLALLSIAFFITEILLSTKGANVRRPEDIKSRTTNVTVGKESHAYCTTSTCIDTANEILKNMDDQVRPCDDFYHFACGGFLKNVTIPDEKSGINIFNIIMDEIKEQLRISVNNSISLDEPKAFKIVKNMYKSCMNESAIKERSLNPLRKVHVKLGGWPVVEGDRWNGSNFNWIDSIIESGKMGYFDDLLKLRIAIDMKNSTKRVLSLDQASLGLSREYLSKGVNDKIVKAYSSYMVDIAVMLGANRYRAEKELNASLAFQIKLANISLPKEERRNATLLYNPMTIKELTIAYPSIPWKKYLNNFLPSTSQLDDNEVVIVNVPSYISDLEKLIEVTDKRTQANYLMWRVAAASVSYLSEDIRRRELEYTTIITGKKQLKERKIECIDIISGDLPIAVGAMYVREYFNENAKENAIEMVTNILHQFKQILENVKWMDDKTKKSALDKVASMTSRIAYPDELLDDSKLEEFYKNLEISENDYFNNILNLSKFFMQQEINKLREPFNKGDWIYHGTPAVVNAFYSFLENSIDFPAGILQGAFFSDDRPKYMNYGAIGFVIGHEITHGFDDQGRQFDKDGNLVDWWAPSTKKKYLEKAECIINQYGNYTVPEVEMNLNGINTQGENIADNGGMKVAYLAYKAWSAVHSPEKRLPGLEKYSPSQMFWISAANTWCSKYRPETLKLRITTGFHSLPEFRILGSLSNMPEFAEDFKCPVGSKMNPKNKCTVW